MKREVVRRLSDRVVSVFGAEKVVCILLHGSLLSNPHLPPHDADIVIVLRSKGVGDCSALRKLVKQSQLASLPIHLHLIYLGEIPTNADFFSLHTCGPFFVCHLRQAETLFGENIFDRVSGPSNYHLQLSLLQKAQQYTFQLRNQVFKVGKVSMHELEVARKRSVVVLKDLLMSDDLIVQQEDAILSEVSQRFPDLWSRIDSLIREVVRKISKPTSDKEARQFLEQCLTIHECAYDLMRDRIARSGKCKFFV